MRVIKKKQLGSDGNEQYLIDYGSDDSDIESGDLELTYVPTYIMSNWNRWGVPHYYECVVIENDAPVPKHIPLHRLGPQPEEFFNTWRQLLTPSIVWEEI
ncbi:hypothetical protein MKW94_022893 [Papaver nudicaule]|uniref:Uncharacterized protein n=1 Tax=Papaver nudicaule TaxID=74823 RepID=A0AA41VVA8_PAPNU|nr:hypothetical protein [Papaver nudicaule]